MDVDRRREIFFLAGEPQELPLALMTSHDMEANTVNTCRKDLESRSAGDAGLNSPGAA